MASLQVAGRVHGAAVQTARALAALGDAWHAHGLGSAAVARVHAANAGAADGVAQGLVSGAARPGRTGRLALVVAREARVARGAVGVTAAFLAPAEHAEGVRRSAIRVAQAVHATEVCRTAQGAFAPANAAFIAANGGRVVALTAAARGGNQAGRADEGSGDSHV
jgi:hypothetical protein